MKLLKTYLKMILMRNRNNYFTVILSIISIYIVMSILMVYIDNILILSSETMSPNFRYLYISIRTVFILGGVTFIVYQYFNIMKSGVRDFLILKSLGATKGMIQRLILIQIVFLLLITIPIGLFSGYYISNLILDSLTGFTLNKSTKELMDSMSTFYIIASITCCLIISIGIYLDRSIQKMPVAKIITEYVSMNKDVGVI